MHACMHIHTHTYKQRHLNILSLCVCLFHTHTHTHTHAHTLCVSSQMSKTSYLADFHVRVGRAGGHLIIPAGLQDSARPPHLEGGLAAWSFICVCVKGREGGEEKEGGRNVRVDGCMCVCLLIVETCVCVCVNRDVSLPLFGKIPLFIFTFRFFQNYFPLFLKNRTKKRKKNHYRHRHYRECSNSFGKQSVTSWFAGLCLLPFPVEVRKRRISTQWSKPCCVLAYSVG